MAQDLGTYHVHVRFTNGEGFIHAWSTSGRYSHGCDVWHPLDATWIPPVWDSEADVLESIRFMYTTGNYSCDCNRKQFIQYAKQKRRYIKAPCGDTLVLDTLAVRTPSGRMVDLLRKEA